MRTTTKNNTNELPRLEAVSNDRWPKMGKKTLKTHVDFTTKKGDKCASNPKNTENASLKLLKCQPLLWLGLRNKIMVKTAQAVCMDIVTIDVVMMCYVCSLIRKTSGFSLKEITLFGHLYTNNARYYLQKLHWLRENGYIVKVSESNYYRMTLLGHSVVNEVLGASVKVLHMIERRLYSDHKNRITSFYTELSPECFGKTGKVVEIDGMPTLEFDDSRYCQKDDMFK